MRAGGHDPLSHSIRNLVIAGVLFVSGLVLVSSYIAGTRARIEQDSDFVRVLVAAKDIPAGTDVKTLEQDGYVKLDKVMRRDAAPQAIHSLEQVARLSTRQDVFRGEQLTALRFEQQSGLGAADQIRGTQRMVSLAFNVPATVASRINPGDHVDIWASGDLRDRTNNERPTTWVVARDAVVVQTPASLRTDAAGKQDAPPEEPKATGDPQIYLLQVSDRTVHDLMWSQHVADQHGLTLVLRPGDGAQNTRLSPRTTIPNAA